MDKEQAQEITKKKRLYVKARKARVGTLITCPWCNRIHMKTTYHKVFCSNAKTLTGGNCKDDYWNTVDPVRAQRKEDFKAGKFETN
jgi:transcription elongation factor Elf1